MREFLEFNDMVAVSTCQAQASSKTWYRGKNVSTRVDYILVDRTRMSGGDTATLSREMHRRLRALVGLDFNDHVPLLWRYSYQSWQIPDCKAVKYDAEAMVRSCLTWDDKALQYASSMQAYFHDEWMGKQDERALDDRHHVDKMADMV